MNSGSKKFYPMFATCKIPIIFDKILKLNEIQKKVYFAILKNQESCVIKLVLDKCDCCDRKDFEHYKKKYNDKIQQQMDDFSDDSRFRVEKKEYLSCLLYQYPHILFEIFWDK